MEVINDEYYMRLALDMANRSQGQTGVNPVVGAVVVKDGEIVGLGSHLKRGTPHAEVHALNMAGEAAKGGTVYVTLEPCSHYGATPPCSEGLIKAGVSRVVVACEDPNPQVAGRGIELLRRNGIEVQVGVLRDEAIKLNRKFIKYITTKMPYVTIKTASTLDGKIASRSGDSKWISNAVARERVHTMRHRHDGIMVGVETVIADDPSLTTRLTVPGISPIRIIVDSKLRIPDNAKMLHDGAAQTILLTTAQASEERRSSLTERGVQIIVCGEGPQVNLRFGLEKLGAMGVSSVLVEGGGRLNGSLLQEQLVDEVILFLAPKLIGGLNAPGSFVFDGFELMKDAVTLSELSVEQIEDNVCIAGYPVWDAK
ncbi:bifunctional diaminohydroxyphosphoribosylaminopyrimidine deaminase/5-amino-6-(5-phosphoribosylamino)uracil reductase RibD [Paenibacillus bouchesdurhonensis]|uniref:bifunctional diaminohydroxyphosphoribosylaminopyrimidine deaminase/5-amino-6-(5-phosphoribosylamino)uracil reductase RibD n=1 Tax=Paenibacillus bouchesdurhonensis TaxID=1870990 RepID=UPI000DA601F0|nr:bifunctional diaminohydroxyphosphoribosylaminopyrimidine deaminase/5-amino-6-(5-phosphoribosylamino)uracil reductase RibD [Paenibacillus bouchesdurhonensis]